jgi:hypothetical protein
MKRIVIEHEIALDTLGEWENVTTVAEAVQDFMEKAWEHEVLDHYPDYAPMIAVGIAETSAYRPTPYRFDGIEYHDGWDMFSTPNELWDRWYREFAKRF